MNTKYKIIILLILVILGAFYFRAHDKKENITSSNNEPIHLVQETETENSKEEIKKQTEFSVEVRQEIITLAGGCFWCIESAFQEEPGVIDAISGYAGGDESTAKYLDVARGKTQHREVAQVTYNPEIISTQEIINIFWSSIDPTDPNGQFADTGFQYTTAIFYHNELQKEIAEKSKQSLNESDLLDSNVVTEILAFKNFFPAEEYHQDYYKKSSEHYKRYEVGSGRKGFVEETWARDAAIAFFENLK